MYGWNNEQYNVLTNLEALYMIASILDRHELSQKNCVAGQFRGKRDKGLEQKLLTRHIVIVYFYRP